MATSSSRPSYWPYVLLMLTALCPGQINFTAMESLNGTIAQALGVSPNDASWAGLLGNAALPLGYLFALTLIERLSLRRLNMLALGLVAASSLAMATAPNIQILVFARMVQGFCFGVLSLSIIPPLIKVDFFPARFLPISIAALVVGLFGASTLGPLVGGVVEQAAAWRALFTINALLALTGLVLARAVVPEEAAPDPDAPFPARSLALASVGVMCVFIGIGHLGTDVAWHNWGSREVDVPVAIGAAALLLLIVTEWVQPRLLTLRYLTRPRPLTGATLCCLATIGYAGLLSLLPAFLQEVRGLGPRDAGLLLWPITAGALVGAVLAGLAYTNPRWVIILALCGVVVLCSSAWLLASQLTAYTGNPMVMLLAALLGLGASVSVAPGMLFAALTVPAIALESTLAFATLVRESLQGVSGPTLGHLAHNQSIIHSAHLSWQQSMDKLLNSSSEMTSTAASQSALERLAVVLGMNDAAGVVVLMLLFGTLAVVLPALPAMRRSPRSEQA
jgi:predicted MFS family arabinose efflux permease